MLAILVEYTQALQIKYKGILIICNEIIMYQLHITCELGYTLKYVFIELDTFHIQPKYYSLAVGTPNATNLLLLHC